LLQWLPAGPARRASRLRVGQLVVAIGNPLGFEVLLAQGRKRARPQPDGLGGPGTGCWATSSRPTQPSTRGTRGRSSQQFRRGHRIIPPRRAVVGQVSGWRCLSMRPPVQSLAPSLPDGVSGGPTGHWRWPRLLPQPVAMALAFHVVEVVSCSLQPCRRSRIRPRDVIVSLAANGSRTSVSCRLCLERLHRPGRHDRVHTRRAPATCKATCVELPSS